MTSNRDREKPRQGELIDTQPATKDAADVVARGGLVGMVTRFASGLRFPYLFALTAAIFTIDFFIPDIIPFVDEIILGLAALLLGMIKTRRRAPASPPPATAPDAPLAADADG